MLIAVYSLLWFTFTNASSDLLIEYENSQFDQSLRPDLDLNVNIELSVERACRAASTATEDFDQNCSSESLEMFYVGFNSSLFQKFTQTKETEMLAYCSRHLDTPGRRSSKRLPFQRFLNAMDLLTLIERPEFCVTIRKSEPEDLELLKVHSEVSLVFHGPRTCDSLNLGEFRYNQFYKACKYGYGLQKPTAFINVHAFYHPLLVSFRHAFISKYGNVISLSEDYDQQVFTYTSACFDHKIPDFQVYQQHPDEYFNKYDKVYTIAQGSGWGTFHALVECLPRIAAHYEELIQNQDIMIHYTFDFGGSGGIEKYFKLMGFPADRLINGPVIANQVFLPETSFTCARSGFYQIRKLHQIIRRNIESKFTSLRTKSDKRHAVFIRRRRYRAIINHDEIFGLALLMFPEFTFELFDDAALPSFEDTIVMFDRADLIIGPHGAGLTNLLLAKAGTIIVEFLNTDSIVLCYPEISAQLGMKYNGLMPEISNHEGFIFPDLSEVRNMFETIRKYQL